MKESAKLKFASRRNSIVKSISLKLWLFAILALSVGSASGQALNGVVLNQQYVDGCSTPHTYLIATLAASTNGTYDHLHLVATLGDWYSSTNSTIDAVFGNRSQFSAAYTALGSTTTGSSSHITAYQQSDGSVNLYFIINACSTATYTVLENQQETVYTSPTDTLGATPPGTLLFDTASASNPPTSQADYLGNILVNGSLGIGTATPAARLHVGPALSGGASGAYSSTFISDAGALGSTQGSELNLANIGFNTGNNVSLGFKAMRIAAGPDWTTTAVGMGFDVDSTSTIGGGLWFSNGGIGVGTTTPSVPLEVNGSIKVDSGAIVFPDGSSLSSVSALNQSGLNESGTPAITQVSGNVGIGTTMPGAPLDVKSSSSAAAIIEGTQSDTSLYYNNSRLVIRQDTPTTNNMTGIGFQNASTYDAAAINTIVTNHGIGTATGILTFLTSNASPASVEHMRIDNLGNVGIGTTSPQAMLDVNGPVRISGNGAGLKFPDGSIQSTAYTGTCPSTGGDYAESVDVEGDKASYEPGDVMVIDPEHPGRFLMSSEPYSSLVAGIYSTKPGYVGRRQTTDPKLSSEIPMAMVGIVPTKATIENGPIKVGDLLVTSSKPGFVMKGTDHDKMTGAIVGKALNVLEAEAGTIEVLVSLQ